MSSESGFVTRLHNTRAKVASREEEGLHRAEGKEGGKGAIEEWREAEGRGKLKE